MKSFFELHQICEDQSSVKSSFDQLRSEISTMFQTLYKAAKATWGKGTPSVDDRSKGEIISGLEAILAKLKGVPQNDSHFIISDISDLLNEEGSLVQGLRPTSVNAASGKPVFSMTDVLRRIEDRIMTSVGNLERSVLMQKVGDIQGNLSQVGSKVGNIERMMDSPRQPLTDKQIDQAYQNMDLLGRLHHYGDQLGVRLIHNSGKEVPLDSLSTPQGKNALLSLASRDRRFKLVHNGGEQELNVGDVQSVSNAMDAIYDAANIDPEALPSKWKTKAFGTVHGSKLKPVKMKESIDWQELMQKLAGI